MPGDDSYRVAASEGTADVRVRGSRFLAFAVPVPDEKLAQARVAACRRTFHDATHIAFAHRPRAGDARMSDAGEPAGTAGRPILAAIDAAELVDTLVVVARWFGGTKLGTAGLARAYRDAARRALARAGAAVRYETVPVVVECLYEQVAIVKRLVRPPDVQLVDEEFGARARFTLAVRRSRLLEVEERLREARLSVGH
jgi:uncharacterized YigZ family protein